MRLAVSAIATLGLVALAPAGLFAQDMAAVCESLSDVEVGAWAKYEVDADGQQGTMRFALIPEGAADDEGQWFELSMDMSGQKMVMQLLVPSWPFGTDDIQGVVVKAGGQPAMRIPDTMLGMMQGQMDLPMSDMTENCAGSELLGKEAVTVPAGTFQAYHIRPADQGMGEGEIWVSEDAPFGLVKAEGDGGSMSLVEAGGGAVSTITETPQDMPGMPGMGNR
ncbi:MAG: DUF3108 domain-containing protein [Gemmatimonadota bacterium]|nr:DUF3108 domain-containing protein [Gemmatimonadota bacterium]